MSVEEGGDAAAVTVNDLITDDKTQQEKEAEEHRLFLLRYDLGQPLTATLPAGDDDEITMTHVFKRRHAEDIVERESATIRKSHNLGRGRSRVEFDSDDANAALYDITIDYTVVTEDDVKTTYTTKECLEFGRGVKIKAVDEVDNVHFRILNPRKKGDFNFLFEKEDKPPILVEQLIGDENKPKFRFVHKIKHIETGTRRRYRKESQDVESETKKNKTHSEMYRNPQPGINLYEITLLGITDSRNGDTPSEDIPVKQLIDLIDPYWRSEVIDEVVDYLDNRGVE
jgi:hypothetical protein